MTDRIIAIGYVHGCSKALATLIEAVQPTELDTLVFLGDYIDRGPDRDHPVNAEPAAGGVCSILAEGYRVFKHPDFGPAKTV
jgi:serine/threonine protein phosphatase 1